MRQIIAAVIRKLLLTIFAPVTVGLLITASASAEPKGSFELSPTIPAIAMVNVAEGSNNCSGRNRDIGVNSKGEILSCQSGGWKGNGGTFKYLGEYAAGFKKTVKMVEVAKGTCFLSGVSTISLNNSDSLKGHIYQQNGYWYLTTRDSYYNRGQTLRAICIG